MEKSYGIKLTVDTNGKYDIEFNVDGSLAMDTSIDSNIISRILTNGDWVGSYFLNDDQQYFKLTPESLDANKNSLEDINSNIKHALDDLVTDGYIDNLYINCEIDNENNLIINMSYYSDNKKYSLSFSIWRNSEWR